MLQEGLNGVGKTLEDYWSLLTNPGAFRKLKQSSSIRISLAFLYSCFSLSQQFSRMVLISLTFSTVGEERNKTATPLSQVVVDIYTESWFPSPLFTSFPFSLFLKSRKETDLISSVRSSSGYHGLIEIRSAAAQTTFSNFSNSSDSKVKVKGPNMCNIFAWD